MEKYEINRFLNEYRQKLEDLGAALSLSSKSLELKNKEKLTLESDFWTDQARAQKTINEINSLKVVVSGMNDLQRQYDDIEEFANLTIDDEETMTFFEASIEDFKKAYAKMEEQALFDSPYDFSDCILELHPGAGGTESMDWADMLYRMYLRFCAKKGFKVRLLDYQAGDEAGIKSVTIAINGPYAYGLFKGERGVHRLVRISPFDANSRRHTSFVSCDISPQVDDVLDIDIAQEDLRIDVFHSSGAGGQSVNTTDSAVRITHKPTGIVVTCQNERSQLQNKEVAMKVLKSKLLERQILQKEAELKQLKGEQMEINFGSQIRSYVFCPYTLVKDHRTNYEVGNINAVMDGDIEGFMLSYLRMMAGKKNG